jgi:MFS family permease
VSTLTQPDTSMARPTRAAWMVLTAMTAGLAMIMLDQTVVTVALPTMAHALPLSVGGQQWVVNSYVLAMAATVAMGGRLGTRLGPVTTFRIGIWIIRRARPANPRQPALSRPSGSSAEHWASPSSARSYSPG